MHAFAPCTLEKYMIRSYPLTFPTCARTHTQTHRQRHTRAHTHTHMQPRPHHAAEALAGQAGTQFPKSIELYGKICSDSHVPKP